jgi:4-aminobutyrate aminotransferase
MIAKRSVMTWPEGAHGNTYGGNPIACAAALATLDLVEKEYMQNAIEVGEYTMDALEEIKVRHKSIGQVRGKGLMIGVDFVRDQETREPDHDLRDKVVDTALEFGLLTISCGPSTIRVSPPLNINRAEIDEGLQILEEAIQRAENA